MGPVAFPAPLQVQNNDGNYSNSSVKSLDRRPTGLRLAWIGDSVTRYQFLSFVHFIHTGRFVEDKDFPNIVDISTYNGKWTNFLEHSSHLLGQAEGRHQCDCYREDGGADAQHIFENRYYRDPERDNFLYFFTKMGSNPFHGRLSPEDASSWNTTFYAFNFTVEGKERWRYKRWGNMIRKIVAKMKPKPLYLIFNQGLWGSHDLNEKTFTEIRLALNETGIRGLYKTTTKRSRETDTTLNTHDVIGCRMIDICMDVSWTANLSGPQHYFDERGTHFVAHVNQMLNEQLLEILQNRS